MCSNDYIFVVVPIGGASLALTAAGIAHGSINTNDAGDCRRNAGKLRGDATARRQEITNINSRISSLRTEISSNQNELSNLKSAVCEYMFITVYLNLSLNDNILTICGMYQCANTRYISKHDNDKS